MPAYDPEKSPALVFRVRWFVGSACLLWLGRNLEVVGLHGDWLWVSNFRRWASISQRDVEAIQEVR